MAMLQRVLTAVLAAALVTACHSSQMEKPEEGHAFGHFEAPVQAEWAPDGRKMVLLRPAVFHDAGQYLVWTAPKDAITDGASIPQLFWSLVSGPFEGLYRDAAVNHDYECCVKQRPWRKVHRMFYNGMRANGVGKARAGAMYWAVYFFGPRWDLPGAAGGPDPAVRAARPSLTVGDARRAIRLLEANPDLSLDEIEALDSPTIRQKLSAAGVSMAEADALDDGRVIPVVDRPPPCLYEKTN